MAGIYVHIPFCKKACTYCNFHFSTSFQRKDELINAIVEEIRIQFAYLEGDLIKTIYYGGGTPSALPPADIARIHNTIRSYHKVAGDAEITLEANPDDITPDNLNAWLETGINRLSIGIQCFQDTLLIDWNRTHNAAQSKASLLLAKEHGFDNISADLIYGGAGLTDADWIYNIHTLMDLNIPHISCYALTVEQGTVLAHQIKKGRAKSPDDEQSSRQYEILQTTLLKNGYEQYEVSNFAKPGYRSKHNTGYWNGEKYLGIGPSAHSYNGVSRQWNVSNNVKYTHALQHHKIPFEAEVLTDAQRFNEIIMTGLRTSKGIDMERLTEEEKIHLHEAVKKYMDEGKIKVTAEGKYALKPEYYFFADGIAADLFLVS